VIGNGDFEEYCRRHCSAELPLVGRFVRERLNGDYVRDEAMQARELTEILAILDAAGVDGAFVAELVTAGATTSDQPRYDLDMNAFSLVKTYRQRKGATYPDMKWEPKQSFSAVASVTGSGGSPAGFASSLGMNGWMTKS
jgi:hypothetical protein